VAASYRLSAEMDFSSTGPLASQGLAAALSARRGAGRSLRPAVADRYSYIQLLMLALAVLATAGDVRLAA